MRRWVLGEDGTRGEEACVLHVAEAQEEVLLLESQGFELLLDRELLSDEVVRLRYLRLLEPLVRNCLHASDTSVLQCRQLLLHLELLLLLLDLKEVLLLSDALLGLGEVERGRCHTSDGSEPRDLGPVRERVVVDEFLLPDDASRSACHEIELGGGGSDQSFVSHVGDGAKGAGEEPTCVGIEVGRREGRLRWGDVDCRRVGVARSGLAVGSPLGSAGRGRRGRAGWTGGASGERVVLERRDHALEVRQPLARGRSWWCSILLAARRSSSSSTSSSST